MDWCTADTSVAVAVPFLVDGEYVIPEAGSVTLTVRGNDGAVLSGYNQLPQPDPTTSSVMITIPEVVNGIGSNTIETRYMRVSYIAQGQPLYYDYRYRLTPFLPISVTPQDVRRELGIDDKALSDADIDLYEAYYSLYGVLGEPFAGALTTAGRAVIHANNMIAIQAAILRIASLQNRIMKSETSHNEIYVRNSLDLQKLQDDLNTRLTDETGRLQEILNGSVAVITATPIFYVTTPVDAITGV